MTRISSTIHSLIFLSLMLVGNSLKAQFYYKDIRNNKLLSKEFSILKNADLKTVKIKSYEDNSEPSEGFFCQKKINKNYSQSQMISRSNITGESLLVSNYNNEGQIVKTIDNTPTTTSTTSYQYNPDSTVARVEIISMGDDQTGTITETREYTYDGNGKPQKMVRKKENTVVSTIVFVKDEKGNIVEENVQEKNSPDKNYFYYYDDENRLTDVVHFNERAGRLLPDYMYEYDESNLPVQMITASETGDNYFIWRYSYNDKNLRESERCFSKEKKLLGKIEYEYQ